MSKSQTEKLSQIHAEAIEEFNTIHAAVINERKQCIEDRRFYSIAGAQWDGGIGDQFANKPKFEVNKVHLAVIRIFNEYRNNRITVDFVSKDGSDNEKLAESCASLYRADEQDSTAEEAYDNAFEEAVGGGFGAWRLRADYEDEEDEENDYQRIKIEPIFDADSCVFFDLDAKRYDKADATRCFVLTSMTPESYKDTYDDDPKTWVNGATGEFEWCPADLVYVAEYYRVEWEKEDVHFYEGIAGEQKRVTQSELEDDLELENTLTATGFHKLRSKKVKRRRVHKYILSGGKVLEDCGFIAGKYIPIVPAYGKRWFVDGIERCMGHVRLSKDAQRLKNMQLSKLAEVSATSSTEKPVFTPEQIAGHSLMWAEDNVNNYPFLLINPIKNPDGSTAAVGAQTYTRPPNVPPAMAALLQVTETDIQDLLGNQQVGEEVHANLSGKAVELVQNKLDMQSFIYMSNMAKSIKRSGEIWLSMAKDILIEEGRKLKGIGDQDKPVSIELMKPVMSENGKVERINDLNSADFDIAVTVGPSSASKRQSTVRALTSMMAVTADPETMQVLSAMTMMNMEGEGVSEVRDYFRKKLVNMGVVKPTEEEANEIAQAQQGQQPDPNAMYLMASAEQAQADAMRSRADVLLTVARAKETEAKTAATLSDISIAERDSLIRYAQGLGEQYQQTGEQLQSSP